MVFNRWRMYGLYVRTSCHDTVLCESIREIQSKWAQLPLFDALGRSTGRYWNRGTLPRLENDEACSSTICSTDGTTTRHVAFRTSFWTWPVRYATQFVPDSPLCRLAHVETHAPPAKRILFIISCFRLVGVRRNEWKARKPSK